MGHRHQLPLLAVVLFAACSEDQPPTAPAEPDQVAESHTAGHKVVNSLADPGNGPCNATQCTLREAINDPQSTEISFAPGLTGTITLAAPAAGGGTLTIDKKLSITGPGTGIVIRRRSTDPDFRVVRVPSDGNVALTNLTIQNGKTDRTGGGIINFGTLRLTNSTVAGNSASFGGGIDNHGTLTLTNSTVARNSGVGIINRNDVTLTLAGSTVEGNSGRGIVNLGGILALTHTTIARNSGGGISEGRGTATVSNSRIVDNSTPDFDDGGGIRVHQGRFTLTNSTVARNSAQSGGGIANRDGSAFTIINSTVVGNSATSQGGGILNEVRVRVSATLSLTNSTVSGNSARSGGGIFTGGFLGFAGVGLRNSTVAGNSATQEGGGIALTDEAGVGLTNSLVAQNSAPTGPDVLDGAATADISARFSLIGDGSGSGITNTDGNQVGSANAPIDPKLGPLANNGGPTRTHALLLGSPAIDAASTPDCPSSDQRGMLRPQGEACDIGSYERAVQ
jgi:CSLREA domain-containing protein